MMISKKELVIGNLELGRFCKEVYTNLNAKNMPDSKLPIPNSIIRQVT